MIWVGGYLQFPVARVVHEAWTAILLKILFQGGVGQGANPCGWHAGIVDS